MAKPPTIDEREFLKLTRNHGEFCQKLRTLGLPIASADLVENAHHVGLSWLRLAYEHMNDGKLTAAAGRDRASYSRSYYAAYNASKSVRYIVTGAVSLTGDDHKEASNLPDDFPDVAKWADAIVRLREHRLRADYDNWTLAKSEFSLTSTEALQLAETFVSEAKKYLETKFGLTP
jgi:HEPN domain